MASWLSISLDAALGCRTNVFQIQRCTSSASKKSGSSNNFTPHGVTIHPQAAPLVSRHVLDALISLAKSFPQQFLTESLKDATETSSTPGAKQQQVSQSTPTTVVSKEELSQPTKLNRDADFWDVLVKLDSLCTTRKGKNVMKTHSEYQVIS